MENGILPEVDILMKMKQQLKQLLEKQKRKWGF